MLELKALEQSGGFGRGFGFGLCGEGSELEASGLKTGVPFERCSQQQQSSQELSHHARLRFGHHSPPPPRVDPATQSLLGCRFTRSRSCGESVAAIRLSSRILGLPLGFVIQPS